MTNTLNRRAILGRLAAGASLAIPAVAVDAVPADADTEIIALSAEIVRRSAEANQFQARIDTLHERFVAILRDASMSEAARSEQARAFSRESGHEAAIDHLEQFEEATARLSERLMTIPAKTQAGRAAKVRALLVYVMPAAWRGPARELDWHKQLARALLGEFAGMTAAELAAT